jgi:hypothetical protein
LSSDLTIVMWDGMATRNVAAGSDQSDRRVGRPAREPNSPAASSDRRVRWPGPTRAGIVDGIHGEIALRGHLIMPSSTANEPG